MAETKKTSKKGETAAKAEKSKENAEERVQALLEEGKKRGTISSKELHDTF